MKVHHWDRHGKRHTPELTPGHCGSLNPDRGRDEHRTRREVDVTSAGDNSQKETAGRQGRLGLSLVPLCVY